MHNNIVQIASRFIKQFKEPDSASRSPVVITGAYIPEKVCKNKKKLCQKKQIVIILRKNLILRFFWLNFRSTMIKSHSNLPTKY